MYADEVAHRPTRWVYDCGVSGTSKLMMFCTRLKSMPLVTPYSSSTVLLQRMHECAFGNNAHTDSRTAFASAVRLGRRIRHSLKWRELRGKRISREEQGHHVQWVSSEAMMMSYTSLSNCARMWFLNRFRMYVWVRNGKNKTDYRDVRGTSEFNKHGLMANFSRNNLRL
jgi:hypothetical protein